jgi:hypothetical protein
MTLTESYIYFITSLLVLWGTSYLGQRLASKMAIKAGGRSLFFLFASYGVVCHELSHAIIAVIFNHKVKGISFFKPDASSTLGYVNHTYNPNSFYQRLGSFFVGFAPLFMAPVFIYWLSLMLLPNADYFLELVSTAGMQQSTQNLPQFVPYLLNYFVFSVDNHTFVFLLWLFISSSIALSCGPSPADIKNSAHGLIHFVIISLMGVALFGVDIPALVKGGYLLIIGLCVLQALTFTLLFLFIQAVAVVRNFVKKRRLRHTL